MAPYRLLAISSTLVLAGALAWSSNGLRASAGASAAGSNAPAGPGGAPGSAAPAASAPASAAPGAAGTPAAAGTSATGAAQQSGAAAAPEAAGPVHRVAIPGGADGKPFPYTVEIPADWQVAVSKTVPGVFIGPAGVSEPETDPRMIYVRVSPASLADPQAVVANIKRSDAADDTWTAPRVEVHETGGVRGVLVQMNSGSGIQARSSLVLKLPLGQTSLDFIASAPTPEFDRRAAAYERVLMSVQPVR